MSCLHYWSKETFLLYAAMATVILAAHDKPAAAWCAGVALGVVEAKVNVVQWVGVGLGGLSVLSLSENTTPLEIIPWLRASQAAAVLKRRVFRPHAWLDWNNYGHEARAELAETLPQWELGPHLTHQDETAFAWVSEEDGQCVVLNTNGTGAPLPEDCNRLDLAASCCAEPRLSLRSSPLGDAWEDTPMHVNTCILGYGLWRAPRYPATQTLRLDGSSDAHGVNQLLTRAREESTEELQGCALPRDLVEALVNLGFLTAFCSLTRRAPDHAPFAFDGYNLWNAIATPAAVSLVSRGTRRAQRSTRRPRRDTHTDAQSLLEDVDRSECAPSDLPRRRVVPLHHLAARRSPVIEDTYDLEGLAAEPFGADQGPGQGDQQEPSVEPSGPSQLDESIHSQSGPE